MRLSWLHFLVACVMGFGAAASVAQTTRNVGGGGPYATIQAGIDAASAGDTVLVAPGTYYENIDFKGKAITVTSSGGAGVTVIDGALKAPAVTFQSGETRASVLSGFTVQHGGVLEYPLVSSPLGGIFVHNSSPIISNNILTQNSCWTIYAAASGPLVQNNVISATQDDQGHCAFASGAGIFIYGNLNGSDVNQGGIAALIEGNTIENNVESGLEGGGGNGGAGVAVWAGNPVIMNNVIRNNATYGSGGGIFVLDGPGTAIVQNLIYGNAAGGGGGGLAVGSNPDPRTGIAVLVANNTVVNNVDSGSVDYVISSYTAQISPSPVPYEASNSAVLFLNNIVTGSTSYPATNCSQFFGLGEQYQLTFQNDILYNSGGPFFGSYCVDVSGKYNNIAADPQFVNAGAGDFHLTASSPAIDHGQNNVLQLFQNLTGMQLTTDFDRNPRVQDATGNGCVIDMGAYEYPGTLSVCGISETLTSSANPSGMGQSVTFTVQLAAANGVPTGAVQFSDGGTVLGTVAVSGAGAASFSTGGLAVGSHSITAAYQPTGTFPADSASLTQVVNGYATAVGLTSSANPVGMGQGVTFTAVVTAASGTPGGAVSFADGATVLATVSLSGGTASFSTAGLAVGMHTITATYGASGVYAGSAATLAETVNGLATMTSLAVMPNPATAFGMLTLTAMVSAASGTPTGTVVFSAGGVRLGSAAVGANGQATVSVAAPLPGSYSVTAAYGGDATYVASVSAAVNEVVVAAGSGTGLTVSPNPAYVGQAVTLTAQVSGVAGQTPAGVVTFYDGAAVMGTGTISGAGVATLMVSTLAAGTHELMASYGGGGGYAGSSSAVVAEVIAPGTFGIALQPAAITLGAGQRGTVQVMLTSVGGFSGALTLSAGAMPMYASGSISPGTVMLAAGGSSSASLVLNTAMARVEPARLPGQRSTVVWAGVLGLLLPMGLRRRARCRGALGMLLLGAVVMGLNGCGTVGTAFHTAAPGSYTVQVTAVDGSQHSRSAVLQVTVMQ